MKNLFIYLIIMGASLTACNSNKSSDQTDKSGPEYTSEYICPHHCEGSGSVEAGKCPVCGMDYVKNENAESTENTEEGEHHRGESDEDMHEHDHEHEHDHGHDHGADTMK